jgi:hypothetical protein
MNLFKTDYIDNQQAVILGIVYPGVICKLIYLRKIRKKVPGIYQKSPKAVQAINTFYSLTNISYNYIY